MEPTHIQYMWILTFHYDLDLEQGSYRQDCVKIKDFSRTSKRLSYCFNDWKLKKNTDLHVKILL